MVHTVFKLPNNPFSNYHGGNPCQGKYNSSVLSTYLQKYSVIIVHIAIPWFLHRTIQILERSPVIDRVTKRSFNHQWFVLGLVWDKSIIKKWGKYVTCSSEKKLLASVPHQSHLLNVASWSAYQSPPETASSSLDLTNLVVDGPQIWL